MSSEYVKLSYPEFVYGKKNLLQSQIELLQVLKHYKSYQQLRKEGFILKVNFKAKLEETLAALQLLDKILPKTSIKTNKIESEEQSDFFLYQKEKLSLEQEIDEIKKKLARLR